MKTTYRLVLCGVAAFALGGCHVFQNNNHFRSSSKSRIDSSARIEMGREALSEGAVAAAIHHFELAILDPDRAADAHNGLGVAYARLGREDLAARYFNAALRLRPDDARFARNLSRLGNSELGQSRRALARKDSEAATMVAGVERDASSKGYSPMMEAETVRRGAVILDNRRATMTRLSSREIVIGQPVLALGGEGEVNTRATVSGAPQLYAREQQRRVSIRFEAAPTPSNSGVVQSISSRPALSSDEAELRGGR